LSYPRGEQDYLKNEPSKARCAEKQKEKEKACLGNDLVGEIGKNGEGAEGEERPNNTRGLREGLLFSNPNKGQGKDSSPKRKCPPFLKKRILFDVREKREFGPGLRRLYVDIERECSI